MYQRRNEGGLTLIELMVIVLIFAMLTSIAILTYVGMKQRAHDRKYGVKLDPSVVCHDSYSGTAVAIESTDTKSGWICIGKNVTKLGEPHFLAWCQANQYINGVLVYASKDHEVKCKDGP